MTRTAAASPAVYREHPIKILRYSAKNLWQIGRASCRERV